MVRAGSANDHKGRQGVRADHDRVAGGVGVEVAQPVGGQVELLDDAARPDHGVIAAAHVDAGADGVNSGRTPSDRRAGLEDDHVEAGPGQVGGADRRPLCPAPTTTTAGREA